MAYEDLKEKVVEFPEEVKQRTSFIGQIWQSIRG